MAQMILTIKKNHCYSLY